MLAGNPAAVCPLDGWLDDATMQAIAAENNLPETAFFVRMGDGFELRWFTPSVEIDLCGHATLASAYVICTEIEPSREEATFQTRSGPLAVRKQGKKYVMDFPAQPAQPVDPHAGLLEALGGSPAKVLAARDYLVVYESEQEVRDLDPDISALAEIDRAVIVTAPGKDFDCVSRFFAPTMGIAEDPATGSAHCTIAPYWSERLGKQAIRAYQASARGGKIDCECVGDRVLIAGSCVLYMRGEIEIQEQG